MIRCIAWTPLKALRKTASHLNIIIDIFSLLEIFQQIRIFIKQYIRSSASVGSNPARRLSARLGIRSHKASNVCTSVVSSSWSAYSSYSSYSISASRSFIIASFRASILRSIKAGPNYLTKSSTLSTAAPLTRLSSSSVIIVSKRGTTAVLKCSSSGCG